MENYSTIAKRILKENKRFEEKSKKKRSMKGFYVLLTVLALIMPTVTIVKSVKFQQECSGYLKQTADANTPELALDRITKAIDYVEAHGLTSGYTSVLWRTEDENVGFWYENLKACRAELEGCLDGTQLEKSNVLMKVRESLTDEGEDGTELTIPPGISRYPHNALFGVLNLISVLVLMFMCGLVGVVLGDR